MRIEIAQSIREILDERKTVTIQGLGSIKLVQKPAYFGELRKSMFPPSVDMVFEETSSSNNVLIQRLMENEGVSKKNAEKALRKYSEAIVNALVNYGSVRLKGICRLDRLDSGKIHIDPDESFTAAYFKDLPEVPAIIVAPKKASKTISTQAPVTPDETPAAIVTTSEDAIKSSVPQPETAAKATAVITDLIAEMKEEQTESTVEPPEEEPNYSMQWDPGHHEEGYGIIPWIIGGIVLIALIAFTVFSFKQCQPAEELPFSNEQQSEHITDILVNESTETSDTLASAGLLTPDKCIIITGSFASQKNVDLMSAKVAGAGHEVYHEVSGNYTRVGLTFDCTDVDLPSYLQNIRATIAPQAWYLDPELYVEYN